MNIEVVTAPEHRHCTPKSLKMFLAGGICKCVQWQKMIIDRFLADNLDIELSQCYSDLYIFNPRREDWVEGPNAAERQIEWEFDMLEKCDVFTMYFAGGESDQPICMYELGRNIEKMKQRFPKTWKERIFITCDSTYKRVKDVIIQTGLATDGLVPVNVVDGVNKSIDEHFNTISENLKYIYTEDYE